MRRLTFLKTLVAAAICGCISVAIAQSPSATGAKPPTMPPRPAAATPSAMPAQTASRAASATPAVPKLPSVPPPATATSATTPATAAPTMPTAPLPKPAVGGADSAIPTVGGASVPSGATGVTASQPVNGAVAATGKEAAPGEETIYLNVQDAEIKDVIKQISKATSKNFIIDDKVKGKITIISERPMTREEAYQTFLSALEVAGFTIVKGPADVIRIVGTKEAVSSPIPTHVDTTPYTSSYITRLIPLQNISALDMSSAIKDLISKSGNMFAYPATNTLIITDSGANIDRLMKIIKELDQEGPQQVLEIIPIRNAAAKDIAQLVNSLYQTDKAGGKAAAPKKGAGAQLEEIEEVSKIIADDRTNSIIVLASKRAIDKVREVIAKLDSRVAAGDEGKIHVYYLKHAKAKTLAETLNSLTAAAGKTAPAAAKGGAAAAGKTDIVVAEFEGGLKITADDATNALIVTSTPKDFKTLIDKVVAKLDIPRRQVYLESVIMELQINKSKAYGVSGHAGKMVAGSMLGFGQTFQAATSGLASLLGASGPTAPTLLGGLIGSNTVNVNLPGANGTTQTVAIPTMSALVNAMQTYGDANVVSTPNILTLDNEPASIEVTKEVAVAGQQTITSAGIPIQGSPQYIPAGLKLKITPQIGEADSVMLKIEQELSNFGIVPAGTVALAPPKQSRKVSTAVVTKDGETVVLGGLMEDEITNTKSKVPILGDIPILGFLFSQTKQDKGKRNLLIFITPHIVKDSSDFAEIMKKKIEQRNKFVDDNYGKKQRTMIRDTIKTHREDLLEYTPRIPSEPEVELTSPPPSASRKNTSGAYSPSSGQSSEYQPVESLPREVQGTSGSAKKKAPAKTYAPPEPVLNSKSPVITVPSVRY